ncbi:cholinesterase 1-like [Physella acuta]|uniref:cholinesterase 1-like n=1 Tax=Physella acuta TaxID=109671 RepID=UPI0027DBDF3D|nr:cholinesterase 1-like [Physella acuta]
MPKKSWTSTVKTTVRPNSCWQTIDETFNRAPAVDAWNANTYLSEDCLYLNAWIPDTTERKSILVWIYGGGFWGGTSTLDMYDGAVLARKNNIIIVSMNYRVGALGFLFMNSSEAPGNVGLLDQQLALKWIHDNAENMGGDPNNISIFGESAGATSVGFHLLSTNSSQYFKNAMMMSGSPTAYWAIQPTDKAMNRAKKLANFVSCTQPDPMKCLRDTKPIELVKNQWGLVESYFDLPFAPVVDGQFLVKHPSELMTRDRLSNRNLLTGVVKDEGSYWLLYGFAGDFNVSSPNINSTRYPEIVDGILKSVGPSYQQANVVKNVAAEFARGRSDYIGVLDDLSGDILFKCGVTEFAQEFSRQGGHVYMYSLEHRASNLPWPQWIGAPHGLELPFFFGAPWSNTSGNFTSGEKVMSQDIMQWVTTFAKTGNPGSVWPEYKHNEQKYLQIVQPSIYTVKSGLRSDTCTYWKDVVPQLLVKSTNSCALLKSTDLSFMLLVAILLLLLI